MGGVARLSRAVMRKFGGAGAIGQTRAITVFATLVPQNVEDAGTLGYTKLVLVTQDVWCRCEESTVGGPTQASGRTNVWRVWGWGPVPG